MPLLLLLTFLFHKIYKHFPLFQVLHFDFEIILSDEIYISYYENSKKFNLLPFNGENKDNISILVTLFNEEAKKFYRFCHEVNYI